MIVVGDEMPVEGPVEPYFDESLIAVCRTVFVVHELVAAGELKNHRSDVALWAARVSRLQPANPEAALPLVPQDLRKDLLKVFRLLAKKWFPESVSKGINTSAARAPKFPDNRPVYVQALKHYEVQIPEGWALLRGQRDNIADEQYDTLRSPDARLTVAFSRLARPAESVEAGMEQFKSTDSENDRRSR